MDEKIREYELELEKGTQTLAEMEHRKKELEVTCYRLQGAIKALKELKENVTKSK